MVPGLCSSSIWATCSTNLPILVAHSQNQCLLNCSNTTWHFPVVASTALGGLQVKPLKWSISSKNVFSGVLTNLWSNRPQVASWDTDVWALVKRLGIWKNWGGFRAAAFSQWVKNLSKNKTSWSFFSRCDSDSWPSGRFVMLHSCPVRMIKQLL